MRVKFRGLMWLGWLALGIAASPASAAPPNVAGEKAPAQRYALLVGVRKYDPNELRPLNYAEKDITDLAEILRASGYKRVVVLTQTTGAEEARFLPTAANIRTALRGILEDRNEQDTVLVAMSGHGVQFPSADKEHPEIYFCPMDTKLANRKTLVSMSDVYKELDGSKAGLKLLIVDACRNNPQSDNSRARAEVDLESVTRPQRIPPPGGTAVLFSCSDGQRAYDDDKLKHGVFFNYVLEGLRGKADFSGKGNVSIDSLALYVKSQVTDYVKEAYGDDVRQVPELIGKTNGLAPLLNLARRANSPSSNNEGWLSLFDGKTLKGWKAVAHPETWSVKNGAIVGNGERSHLFFVDQEFSDFAFKADIRLNHGGNSGMFFRARFGEDRQGKWPDGYEAQANNTHADPNRTGSLIDLANVKAAIIPDDTWWTQEVIAQGNHITIKVNNTTTADIIDVDGHYKKGYLALQQLAPGTIVEFKNLMVRPLPPNDGWISIFDGKTLKGWKPTEHAESWSVKDGVLVGKGERSHLFYMDRELIDFEFKADARLNRSGNSGMYFRAEFGAGRFGMFPKGYEAQIALLDGDPKYTTGSLYGFAAARVNLIPDNTWFNQHVIVRGNHITILVDGKPSVDFVDKAETYKKGLVALQMHGTATLVEFKNLMIRPLPTK